LHADAHELMDRLCALANDVGLLSEEYDWTTTEWSATSRRRFSHLTLVQAALSLRSGKPRTATARPLPQE